MSAQYDPNKQGWGAALVTCVFTGALLLGAWTIHKNTYRHPRDPMNVQVYHDRDNGGHGEATNAASHDTASHDTASHDAAGHEAPAEAAKH